MNRILSSTVVAVALVAVSAQAGFRATPMAASSRRAGMPFTGQLSLGLANGEGKEHVYDYDGPGGSRRQLSRLDWDIKNVIMGGGSLSVRPFNQQPNFLNRFTVNGGMWIALTEGSGEMDDYDWLDTGSSEWTHYSLSDVDVTEGYIFDLNLAFDVWANPAFTVRAMAGYKQDGWSWEDSGQYALYPDYGYIPVDLGGENMINYEQEFCMPYLGATVDWNWQAWTVSGYLTWSPIVEATDWDEHLARNLDFKETFEDGDMLGLGIEARYDLTQMGFSGWFVTAALDYQKIDLIVGDMHVRNTVTGETGGDKDVAGIENKTLLISVGGGLRF
ncbi:MAG: omptin family outer membrane protease [Kiritimatiellae bacterium]|nr:omptin family outer membrane protease [Kiritimatiellia bacterium]MDD4341506.1 omptin family outer membrane protease [Kiritimatiellia bacterium]